MYSRNARNLPRLVVIAAGLFLINSFPAGAQRFRE